MCQNKIAALENEVRDLTDELEEKSELVVDLKSKARKDHKLHDARVAELTAQLQDCEARLAHAGVQRATDGEVDTWRRKCAQLERSYAMLQDYMDTVKNIEVAEREQSLLRDKLARRAAECEKREQAVQMRSQELEAERQQMSEKIKSELKVKFDTHQGKDFVTADNFWCRL